MSLALTLATAISKNKTPFSTREVEPFAGLKTLEPTVVV